METTEYGSNVKDPAEVARLAAQHEEFSRNEAWMNEHWGELEQQAMGQFLVVAGLQAFIADTVQRAVEKAKAAHPKEAGVVVKFVPPRQPPRR
jgi:hypothetical protein